MKAVFTPDLEIVAPLHMGLVQSIDVQQGQKDSRAKVKIRFWMSRADAPIFDRVPRPGVAGHLRLSDDGDMYGDRGFASMLLVHSAIGGGVDAPHNDIMSTVELIFQSTR